MCIVCRKLGLQYKWRLEFEDRAMGEASIVHSAVTRQREMGLHSAQTWSSPDGLWSESSRRVQ